MSSDTFAFKVGSFNCLALYDLDWVCALFIDTGNQRVLVDAGCGPTLTPPGQLIEQLQRAGVSPAEVDVLILSHADCDHIGGAVAAGGGPAFPNARYSLSREEWAYRESQPVRIRRELNIFLDETFFQWSLDTPPRCLAALRHKLEVIEAGDEIVPGIHALAAPGHTPGMIAVSVASGTEHLLYIGDVIHGGDLSQDAGGAVIAPAEAWHAFIDVDPALSVVTRERLFDQASKEQTLLMAPHFPMHGLGYVSAEGSRWRWRPHHV